MLCFEISVFTIGIFIDGKLRRRQLHRLIELLDRGDWKSRASYSSNHSLACQMKMLMQKKKIEVRAVASLSLPGKIGTYVKLSSFSCSFFFFLKLSFRFFFFSFFQHCGLSGGRGKAPCYATGGGSEWPRC